MSKSEPIEKDQKPDTERQIMTAIIGKITEFNNKEENWEDYVERFEWFLQLNITVITTEEQKKACLFNGLGAKNYTVIKSLLSPSTPQEASYDEVKRKCTSHFTKKVNELLARVKFQKRDQKEGEDLKEFIKSLRTIAKDCHFGKANESLPLEIMIRDRFVAGIRDEELQRYLCRRHEEVRSSTNKIGLSLDKTIEIATSIEGTQKQQKLLKQTEALSVQKTTRIVPFKNHKRDDLKIGNKACFRCGKGNHSADNCFHKNAVCKFCKKSGHVEAACITKQYKSKNNCKKRDSNTHNIGQESDSESEEDRAIYMHAINNTKSINKVDEKYETKVIINGLEIEMEVDNGAQESLINYPTFKKIWKDAEPIWSENLPNIRAWGKRPIKTKGTTLVTVKYKGIKRILPLIVTEENNGPNLLGANWFNTFGIQVVGIQHITECNNYKELLRKFPEIGKTELSGHIGEPAHIELKNNATPKFFKARRVPFAMIQPVKKALLEMINQKMLTAIDQSDWATPALFVRKANGDIRVVGDYKITLNPVIKESEYQLPTVQEVLTTLNGGQYFSQIDLKNAYKQIRVDEETAKILTLSTPLGLFKVNVLLDGLNIAPHLFQKFMVSKLQGIPGVVAYLDNIKIQGSNILEHDDRLQRVLQVLDESNLRININKTEMGVKSMEFLGFQISAEGIKPLKSKIKAISEMPAPKDVKELQCFLGGINFYARHIKNRVNIAEPLHRLLDKNEKWSWGKKHQNSFQKLKTMLINAPILWHYDENKHIVVSADASPVGIGGILAHVAPDGSEHPVAYTSKTLNKTQRNYSQIEKEALALVTTVKQFHQYLAGRKFKLMTDHKPLLGIFNPHKPVPEIISPKLSRIASFLRNYEYELEYRPAGKNTNADLLSRLPIEEQIIEENEKIYKEVSMIEDCSGRAIPPKMIAEETAKDPVLRMVANYVKNEWPNKIGDHLQPFYRKREELSEYKNCILWGTRVIIPTNLQGKVLKLLHASHPGIRVTKALARSHAWWPGIDKQIESMIKNCEKCIEVQSAPPKAPVITWNAPEKPWSRIHVDFAGPFEGYYFLIVVDSTSKWLEVRRVSSISSLVVIKELRKLFATFGIPDTVVSDNGPGFASEELKAWYEKNGINQIFIAPYNPAANGQAERMVQTTKKSLKKLSEGNWETKLSRFLLKQHSTPSATTGHSPAKIMFGRNIKTILDTLKPRVDKEDHYVIEGKSGRLREIEVGSRIRMRNYRSIGPKWIMATVINKLGNRNYIVKENDTGLCHKRDIDQIVQIPPQLTIIEGETDKSVSTTYFDNEPNHTGKENRPETTVQTDEGPDLDTGDDNDQPVEERRRRPKRKCVDGKRNRYRESLLESSIVEGLK